MHYRIDIDVKELNIAELNECLKENTKVLRRWESICNKHTRYELAMEKAGKSITNAAKKDAKMSWNIYDSLKAHRDKIKQEIFNNQKQQ